jgi:ElaB/YqjD/DUF883 family membrane-anchored ribosome-binding protein
MDFKPEDTLKKIAKDVTDAAQPYIDKVEPMVDDLRNKAVPVMDDLRSKATPVVDDIKSKATPVAQDLLDKAEPVLNMVKEKAAPVTKKATQAAKTVSGGISQRAAKVTCKEEIYVQYSQHEVRTTDIMDRAKEDYVNKGNKLTDIKEIQVYIKPSDNAAYYVVNHSETGKIEF